MKKHRLELKEFSGSGGRGWTCQASGTYTGHGLTRWRAIGDWHALLRRYGTLTTPRPLKLHQPPAHDARARSTSRPV